VFGRARGPPFVECAARDMYARTASNPRRERVAHPLKKLTMRTALSHLSTVRLASLSKTVFLTKSLDRTRSRDTRSISDGKCPRISRSGCVRLKTESQNEHIGAMVGSQESQLSGTSDWGLRLSSFPRLIRPFFQLPTSNPQPRTSSAVPTTQVESASQPACPVWTECPVTALPPISQQTNHLQVIT